MILIVVALVTASFRPAQPTVGDLITIDFQQSVVLDASPDYEIVSQRGSRVVVRSFQPRPFALSGVVKSTGGDVRFRNLQMPMRSVLKQGDDLKPAPLRPPRAIPYERLPFVLIAIAALLAAAVWAAVMRLAKRTQAAVEAPVDPLQRFRTVVLALRDDERAPRRWASLADATRAYLAATHPNLGADLTTTQLVERVRGTADAGVIAEVLRQGDLEKFSPWGAAPADFSRVAMSALELARPPVVEEEAAA